MKPRWRFSEVDPQRSRELGEALGITAPAARVLWARGIREPETARRFLHPELRDLNDPYLLTGMHAAVARVRRAVEGGQRILIYGDYDVDGVTSVVILKKAIELAGGIACFHVPDRLKDGYGMRADVVDRAAAEGISLVVSVDTGIRAAEVVRHARRQGIDVIVTDHHLPDQDVPPACAVLNPNQPGCAYPDKNLCGAGVAFKLVQAILAGLAWPPERLRKTLESFLKMVAIATVADVVPLTGENRVVVRHGLSGLGRVRNPGLRAILDIAGFANGRLPSAGDVAFRIAPRLNAAGRMASASDAVELFTTADQARARELARRLHERNAERQQAEAEMVRSILARCEAAPVTERDAALVFCGAGWHRGVLGIVASRIMERFHRPVCVLSCDAESGLAHGSGRSIRSFHLLEALESMQDVFIRFGGHRYAAGVVLESGRVDEFRMRLNDYASARLAPADFAPEIAVDTCLELPEIGEHSIGDIMRLAPFGFGNPAPVFAVMGAELACAPAIVKDKHVRLVLRQGGKILPVMAWAFAGSAADLRAGDRVEAAIAFEPDNRGATPDRAGWRAFLRGLRAPGRDGEGEQNSRPHQAPRQTTELEDTTSGPI